MEAREGSEGQSHKEEEREGEWNGGGGHEPLAKEGGLCLFLVTPLLMGRSPYLARAGLKSQFAPERRLKVGDRITRSDVSRQSSADI